MNTHMKRALIEEALAASSLIAAAACQSVGWEFTAGILYLKFWLDTACALTEWSRSAKMERKERTK